MPRNFEYEQRADGDVLHIHARGRDVLTNPLTNIGTAFTKDQRSQLGIAGLLPPQVMSMSVHLKRSYAQYQRQPDPLSKYLYLNTMHERNEVLYYRLLTEHIEEMMPIVYTPTIGEAIQEYSAWYHRPRGVYLSIDEPDEIETALTNMGHRADEVDLIVVTDSEGILGIGDQGVGGVAITIGKLSLYVAAAGINPHRVLPVVLDVGTDNLDLLSQEGYLGVHHARVRGQRYDDFVERFVQTATSLYPDAMIHWEDFGPSNAHRILEKYRDEICTFNDDIQGTAAVVVAAILSAVRASGTPLDEQRVVIHGAGTAGIGIADLMVDILVDKGVDRDAARRMFWGLGSRGLLREGVRMRDFQQPYARTASDTEGWVLDHPGQVELADVVRNVHPTILIGSSAQPGSFTPEIVTDMAAHCERPVIMPLSNPTSKAEALPSDLLRWTDGRALIATGSPFEPVVFDGTTYHIAQANNALVFPGIGLGVVTSRASRVSDHMIAASARAVARVVTDRSRGASLLPDVGQLRSVSAKVGVAVAEAAIEEGLAQAEIANPIQAVYANMWQPVYPRILAE
ncbi:MAG TPA: NAD-dependent malic enzyme [Propionibacteriaceae bacterium]|nr:NAD-dependent malic enzyme [Propionibacteriaceae bacterium]